MFAKLGPSRPVLQVNLIGFKWVHKAAAYSPADLGCTGSLQDKNKSEDLLYKVTCGRNKRMCSWGGEIYADHAEASPVISACSLLLQNGLPSPSKSYVFNGDFVDRGKQSLEILIILFTFLLIYPKEVHLNRGNHEDHMVNLRYGFCAGLIAT